MNNIAFVPTANGYEMIKLSSVAPVTKLDPAVYKIDMTMGSVQLVHTHKLMPVQGRSLGKDLPKRLRRIEEVADANKNKRPTGVLLSGPPGTGKTRLMNMTANRFIKKGLPVIEVTEAIPANILTSIVEPIKPCVVVFDETTTVYSGEEGAPNLLDLVAYLSNENLSGVVNLLCTNHIELIPFAFLRRPGRLHWNMQFNCATRSEINDAFTAIEDKPDVQKLKRHVLESGLRLDEVLALVDLYTRKNNLTDLIEDLADLNVELTIPDLSVTVKYDNERPDLKVSTLRVDVYTVEISVNFEGKESIHMVDLSDPESNTRVSNELDAIHSGIHLVPHTVHVHAFDALLHKIEQGVSEEVAILKQRSNPTTFDSPDNGDGFRPVHGQHPHPSQFGHTHPPQMPGPSSQFGDRNNLF